MVNKIRILDIGKRSIFKMTGINFGIGSLLAISLFYVFFVPIITIVLLNSFKFFNKYNESTKILIYTILFIFFFSVTFIIIRSFHSKSFKFLFFFIIISIILFVVQKKVKKY